MLHKPIPLPTDFILFPPTWLSAGDTTLWGCYLNWKTLITNFYWKLIFQN